MKAGTEIIKTKRERQVEKHRYSYVHDLTHTPMDFINAAKAYMYSDQYSWPFDKQSFKLGDRIENLANAGAMIAAAIDRIQCYEVGKIYKSGSCMQPGTFKVVKIKSLKTHTCIYFEGIDGSILPDRQTFMIGSLFDSLVTPV